MNSAQVTEARSNAAVRPDSGRMYDIDVTRGLLIFWMVTAHAITLSEIPRESWLFYLRPPGWATHGFVMLSGFSMAVALIGRSLDAKNLTGRLRRRAWQLLAYGFISEFASRILTGARSIYAGGVQLAALLNPLCPWSISAFLLPTALLFGFCSVLALIMKAPRRAWSLASIGIAGIAIDQITAHRLEPAYLWLTKGNIVGLPVLYFFCLGLLGLILGLLSKHYDRRLIKVVALPLGILMLIVSNRGLATPTIHHMGTFLITLALGGLIVWIPGFGIPRHVLGMLGRSALLVFILHRPLLHVLAAVAPSNISKGLELSLLLPISLFLLVSSCWYKEHSPRLAAKLKRVGL